MFKKYFSGSMISFLLSSFRQTNEELLDYVKKLENTLNKYDHELTAVKKEMANIKAVHSESVNHYISEEIKAQLSKQKPLLSLYSDSDEIAIKGDLRIRYERRSRDTKGNDDTRDRFRQRFRLGFTWKNTESDWLIGAGLATGDQSATSTNDTYSDGAIFETGDIRLDYAYAQRKFYNHYTLTLGQQKNPFVSSGILWDGDIRPVGVTLNYSKDNLFATVGAYDVIHVGNDANDAFLFTLQGGYKSEQFVLALTYYHFTDALTSSKASNISGLPANVDDDLEFQILSLYSSYSFSISDVKLDIYSEASVNLHDNGRTGIDQNGVNSSSGNDNYYLALGTSIKYKNFKFKYNYAYIESDSIFGGLKDSDFVTSNFSTNVKGHKIGLDYQVSKNITLGSTLYLVDEINGSESLQQLELDVIYKF